jgi:prepilin-type N-terminal cleavage/methylation domain-containing protein
MKLVKGFTLVELLIAVALTAFVVTVSYSFFNLIEKSGKFSAESGELQSTIVPLFYTLLRDFESIDKRYGAVSVRKDSDNREMLEFYTNSCYYFKGICRVEYWIYENEEKKIHYLIRSEYRINSLSPSGIDIPLTSKVSDFQVLFSRSGDWYNGTARSNPSLLKIVLKLRNEGGELPLVFKLRN